MIEFVGHLTGNAFKYYKKTMIKTSQIVFLIGFGIAMPIMFFVFNLIGSVDLESILFAASVCLLSAIFLLCQHTLNEFLKHIKMLRKLNN